MTDRSTKVGWGHWQRYRYQSLCAEGLAAHIAYPIAQTEAKVRRALARIIGTKHARDADLVCHFSRDGVRFALRGTDDGLSEQQLEAVASLNRRATT